MSEPAVRIEGVTKVYTSKRGRTTALEDLNISIAPGEIFGLLGPNGAGKTTTVRIVCGLIAPTAGRAFVDGICVADNPNAARSRIGLLPEDAGDYRNLTLAEELEYHGAMYGLSRAVVQRRSQDLIRRLDLQGRTADRLKTFSRGMRRKFHLIRAMLHEPRVLLLDEPTAGLDPSIVQEVWDLLKTLAVEKQVTVILCSHHLEEVERLCGRVAILKRRLLIEGTLAELSGGGRRYRMELTTHAAAFLPSAAAAPGVANATADGPLLRFDIAGDAHDVVPIVVQRLVTAGAKVLALLRDSRDLRSLYRLSIDDDGKAVNGEAHG